MQNLTEVCFETHHDRIFLELLRLFESARLEGKKNKRGAFLSSLRLLPQCLFCDCWGRVWKCRECVCVRSIVHLEAHQWEISPHIWILRVQVVRLSQGLLCSAQVVHLHDSRHISRKVKLPLFLSNWQPASAVAETMQPVCTMSMAPDGVMSNDTFGHQRQDKAVKSFSWNLL